MLYVHSFVFSPIQENTYVLYNEEGLAAIIDPGCYYDDEKEELSDFISSKNLTVTYLLNTHCHLDHIFGNKYIAETYQLPLHLHALEEKVLEAGPSFGLMWNLPFDNYQGRKTFIDESNNIQLGSDTLSILHCPGHSPGSICFYYEPGKFIISGDVLFNRSIGRTDLPGGDFQTLETSILNKMYALPDDTSVYSGHGPATTIGEEKQFNPFVKMK